MTWYKTREAAAKYDSFQRQRDPLRGLDHAGGCGRSTQEMAEGRLHCARVVSQNPADPVEKAFASEAKSGAAVPARAMGGSYLSSVATISLGGSNVLAAWGVNETSVTVVVVFCIPPTSSMDLVGIYSPSNTLNSVTVRVITIGPMLVLTSPMKPIGR